MQATCLRYLGNEDNKAIKSNPPGTFATVVINMDRYEVKRKIGQGSFGNVYLTIHRKTRRSVVLKEVKVSRMNTKERQDVAKEVDLLSKLSHPNIIQYVDSFSDNIG